MESPFTNSRNAMILAGVILTLALVVSVIASAFVPADVEPEMVAVEEAEEPKEETRVASAPAAETGWADSGFSDDWGTAATGPANSYSSNRPDELGDAANPPQFGEFNSELSQTPVQSINEGEGPTYKAPSAIGGRQPRPGRF